MPTRCPKRGIEVDVHRFDDPLSAEAAITMPKWASTIPKEVITMARNG